MTFIVDVLGSLKRLSSKRVYPTYKPYSIVMPLRLLLEFSSPPRIILPRVLRGCFVGDIPLKRLVRFRFSEEE